MKERIVINQDWLVKDMKAGVPELDKLFICQKVEQVPESWEELKELCKGRNKIRIANVEGTESIIFNDNIICNKYGNVFAEFPEYTYCFAKNRTIPQLWAFIKSLIGEE